MLLPLDTLAALLYLGLLELRPPPESAFGPLEARWGLPPGTLALPADLVLVLLALGVSFAAGVAARHLACRGTSPGAWIHERGRTAILSGRVGSVLLLVALMEGSTWPYSLPRAVGLGENLLAAQLLGLLTFVLLALANWIPLFPVHRRISAGEWTLRSYLVHRVRYTFFLLGLWVPLLVLAEFLPAVGVLVTSDIDAFLGMGLHLFVLLPLVIWLFPFFLRHFWGCRPLTGELRGRIEALQARAGVRFSRLFVWDFGGNALVNAAAVGAIPPFRYLFLSRGLLAQLSPDEIEAVVAHEMGHIRHHHILFYAVTTFTVFTILAFIVALPGLGPVMEMLLLLGGMLLYFRLVFGFLSRRFEREADLFSLEVTGSAAPLARALERIAIVSGNIRSAPSWHHGSIAGRVRFLQAAENAPARAERHLAAARTLRRTGYLLAAVVLAGMLWTSGAQPVRAVPVPAGGRARPASPELRRARHWRRVRQFLPENPAGPLALARLYAEHLESPDGLARAELLAAEAIRRAESDAARSGAAALLERIRARRNAPRPEEGG